MSTGFGGKGIYNRASPSSHQACVDRIVADYLKGKPPHRVLDVGGTSRGFRALARLPQGGRIIIANPEADVGADYKYVNQIPPTEGPFDLAMMFGLMMYLTPPDLSNLMRDVRRLLRGGGTLLIAEPDPKGVIGGVEVVAKKVFAAARSLVTPTSFNFYSRERTREMLVHAGFGEIVDRTDLTPTVMRCTLLPPIPPYFAIAATVGRK